MNTPVITATSLYFREGNSDKEYHLAVEPCGEGYIVTYAYGRRGSNLTTGTKTPHIVTLAEANAIHDKLVREKTAKGYQPAGETKAPYQQTGSEGQDSGIRCQLLNAIDESVVSSLLIGRTHCLQEKHDGRRLMVRKHGNEVTGINRRGLVVAIPDPIREAVEHLPFDVLIDGEAVGEMLHAFDLLELKGHDLRQRRYLERFAGLLRLLDPEHLALRPVSTVVEPVDKRAMFDTFRQCGCEGVVFKDVDAPFSPGRPNSGGPQLKFKFVESASFVVTGHNAKRSVTLGLYDAGGDTLVPAGEQGVSGASGIVASDEFDRQPSVPDQPLAWQWNHNPEPRHWSVAQRPGYLSLVTSRIVSTLTEAPNTLTQRTFGPDSSATTSIDVSGMKDGDYAGIAAFQKRYGFVGVKMSGGVRSLVMVSADSDTPEKIASAPLSGNTVHLKVECEFEPSPEVARFSYSLDGKSWTPIGRPSNLSYTFPHFMGYRFALFYYSTKTAGGRVDFDYYRVGQGGDSR